MPRLLPLLLLLAVAGCQPSEEGLTAAASPATENPLDPEPEAAGPPVIEIDTPDALREAIRDTDAEVVLVNVWATWCGPCRVEFPELVRYDADKAGEGVEVRFVSVDMPADAAFVTDFLTEHGVTDPSYHFTGAGELIGEFDPTLASVLPATLVFDQDGTYLKGHQGMLTYDAIDRLIAEATSA